MTEARVAEAKPSAPAAAQRAAQRRRLVVTLQIAVLALVLGSWELCARTGIVDPFFFGKPSGIVQQIREWIAEGTSLGPLWVQILVTLEETLLGFGIGALLGIVFGVALGRNRLLADVFDVYVKIANSIPRVVLASVFSMASLVYTSTGVGVMVSNVGINEPVTTMGLSLVAGLPASAA